MPNPETHIEELAIVLDATKSLCNQVDFWAFKGAFTEVAMNLSYLRRRTGIKDKVKAAPYIIQLEALYKEYENVLTTKDFISL